jgi:hypothetical protein
MVRRGLPCTTLECEAHLMILRYELVVDVYSCRGACGDYNGPQDFVCLFPLDTFVHFIDDPVQIYSRS